MTTGTIRLGFVGLRNIGRGHVNNASQLEGAQIAAYADTDETRMAECCDQLGKAACYSDANALFADENVDAVVLSLPNHLHAPMTIAALQAGKHVMIEKPVSRTAEEARQMIAARDAAGKVLMVGMNQRFNTPHRAVKQSLDAGTLGAVNYVRTRWLMQRPHEGLWGRGDWFLSKKNGGGGPLLDLGVHRLDLALHLMGFPEVASITGSTFQGLGQEAGKRRGKTYEIEDGGVAFVRFKNGASLVLESSYFVNLPAKDLHTTELACEHGYAVLGEQCCVIRVTEEGEEPLALAEAPTGSSTSVEHFVNVLQGKEELSPTPEQALVSMEILEALYTSAETGETVYF